MTYTLEDIIQIVKKALIEITKNPSILEMDNDVSLTDTVGLDSMSTLSFFMVLEEKIEGLHVEFESLELDDLKSIHTVSSFVEGQVGG